MRTRKEIEDELASVRGDISRNKRKEKQLETELLTITRSEIPNYTGKYVKFKRGDGVMHVEYQSIVGGNIVLGGVRIYYDDTNSDYLELDVITDDLYTTPSYIIDNPYEIITKEEYDKFLIQALENIKRAVEE